MNDKKMILKTKGLIKKYGDAEVLSGINLEIREGSFTVIMGPSGSGKSTLLYCLSGMEHSSEGQILYNGLDITNISPDELTKLHGNDFGFIFQSDRLVGRDDESEIDNIKAGDLYLFSGGQLRLYFKDIEGADVTATFVGRFKDGEAVKTAIPSAYEENRGDTWNVDVYFLIRKN